jgi:osmoprotectant transport system ATP-binding protein
VAVVPEPTVALGSPVARARDVAVDDWVLVVDDTDRPQGWLHLRAHPDGGPGPAPGDTVTPQLLNLGGTLSPVGGTLREALDAALSSPSGRGVVVDDAGRLVGSVGAGTVLEHLHDATADVPARVRP